MDHYVLLLLVGLLAGLLGGLLGIGGSVLMIPALIHLATEPDQHLFQGTAMMVNFCVILPAVIQHRRAGAILRPIIRVSIPAAVVSVLVGVRLSTVSWFAGTNEVHLSRCFGGFLFYVAAYNVYRMCTRQANAEPDDTTLRDLPAWKIAATVGIPMGLIGGLLGVGGGIIATPCQQVFLKLPLRRAIANSAATMVLLSLVGATYKNISNAQAGIAFTDALKLALCLAPTAVVGSFFGARLTHRLSRNGLRVALVLLMCYGGYKMIRRSARGQNQLGASQPVAQILRRPNSPTVTARRADRNELWPTVAPGRYPTDRASRTEPQRSRTRLKERTSCPPRNPIPADLAVLAVLVESAVPCWPWPLPPARPVSVATAMPPPRSARPPPTTSARGSRPLSTACSTG